MSEYGHVYWSFGNCFMDSWGVGPYVIEVGTKQYRFEDSDRFGPMRIKKDGELSERPFFAERSPFWYAWGKWVEQGRRLSDDGITCVWSHDEVAA